MQGKYETRFMYDHNKYKIVIDYFSYILNNNFLLALTYFSEGNGFGYDYTGLNFATDEKTNELIVVFYDFDYEIFINFGMFINSLKLACEIYIEENISEQNEVFNLFKLTCDNLLSRK